MSEIEDRSCTCDCGARDANTALHQQIAVLEAENERLRAIVAEAINGRIYTVKPGLKEADVDLPSGGRLLLRNESGRGWDVWLRRNDAIDELYDERDRLRAERDALIGLCIHEVPPEDPRCPRYTHWSYEGASTDEGDELTEWESLWVARDSRAEAVAAVRRAAGLDAEPDTGEGR